MEGVRLHLPMAMVRRPGVVARGAEGEVFERALIRDAVDDVVLERVEHCAWVMSTAAADAGETTLDLSVTDVASAGEAEHVDGSERRRGGRGGGGRRGRRQ